LLIEQARSTSRMSWLDKVFGRAVASRRGFLFSGQQLCVLTGEEAYVLTIVVSLLERSLYHES